MKSEKKDNPQLHESVLSTFRMIVMSQDTELIKGYITGVHNKMDQDYRDKFIKNEFIQLISPDGMYYKGSVAAKAISEAHPFSQESAKEYIDQYILSKDRKSFGLIDDAVESIGELRSIVFFDSIVLACPVIAKKIVEKYGAENLDCKVSIEPYGAVSINGVISYSLNNNLTHYKNEDLLESIKIGHEYGFSDVFKLRKNPYGFFYKNRLQEDRIIGREKETLLSASSLPVLIGGSVGNSGLVLCMKERLDSAVCVEAAFERVPFWASREDAIKLSSVRIYESTQNIRLEKDGGEIIFDYKNMKSTDSGVSEVAPNYVRLDFKPVPSLDGCSEPQYFDDARLAYMVDRPTALGLSWPEGKLLCIADVNELMQMNVRPSSYDLISSIQGFLNKYGLFQVLTALDCDPTILDKNTGKRVGREFRGNSLYKNTADQNASKEDVSVQFVEAVSAQPELLDSAVEKMGQLFFDLIGRQKLSVNNYSNLYKHGNYNNHHYKMQVTSKACVKELYESGFKFSEGSRSCTGEPGSNVMLDILLNRDIGLTLVQMNLWPGAEGTKPESIKEGLHRLSIHPDNILFQVYLMSKEPGDIARECSSEKDWKSLVRIAGYRGLDYSDILPFMPSKEKREILETGLGI